MAIQEAEDGKLSEGLVEFTQFYDRLSTALEEQIEKSRTVENELSSLEDSASQISQSMTEQKIGMEQAAESVVQVQESATMLNGIIVRLRAQIDKFNLERIAQNSGRPT
jgi:hypothetical protein